MKKYVITFYIAVSLSVIFSITCLFLNSIQIENVHVNMIHNVFIGLLSSSLLLTVTSLLEYFAERKRALIELNLLIKQAVVLFENIRRVPDIDNYLDTRILSWYVSFPNTFSVHKRFGEYVTQTIRENYLRDKSLPLDIKKREEWRKKFLEDQFSAYTREPLDYSNTACEKFDKDFMGFIQGCYNDFVFHRECSKRNEDEDDEPIDIDYEDLLEKTFKWYFGFEFVEQEQKKQEMKKNILKNLNSIIQPYIKIRDWYNSYDFKILCESFFFINPFTNKSHREFLKGEIFGFISYFCERICQCVDDCLLYLNDFDCLRLQNSPPWGRRSSGKTTEDVIEESNTDVVFDYLVYEVYRKIVIHRHYYYVKGITTLYLYENKVSRYLRKAHQYIFKLIKFKKTADVADLKSDLTSDWKYVKDLPEKRNQPGGFKRQK